MSTIRDDGFTIPSGVTPGGSGTVHGGGPDITSGMHGAALGSASVSLKPGNPLVINSITYLYQGVISKSTGEAEIFLLSKDGKKCVFKLYYPNFKPKEDIVKQLKQINHCDIINVLDYGYYNDRFFEIMDYAEGGTLEKHLPIKDVARIKQIIAETINAFKFCHANGIIHKDIKPQNLYYKNTKSPDILIGDFGISTMLETGMSRHLTSQSLTVGYAAPEMYGIGGKAYVGREVDYYALGITIIHVWDGKNPFDGLNIHVISNLTTSGKVRIPEDMPKELQKLVKGLITVDYTKRWGYTEIQRWLKGENVPIHFQVKEINYTPYQFGPHEIAITVEDMAALLMKYPDRGKKQLYGKKISGWVNQFNQGLSSDLDIIVEDDYPRDQDSGIQKAIYMLDLDLGFVAKNEKECKSAVELADAIEADESYYLSELAEPNHPFYLYLEAHDAKKEADTFRKYFNTFSAKKALNTIILELRGRESIKLGNELFFFSEELLNYRDQQFLISELKDTESKLSLWIAGSNSPKIIKQVEKWRSLDWHDEVTLAYALSKKSARQLSQETIKTLNDTYIIPDEINKALQSFDIWEFFGAIEQLTQLQNEKKIIEKKTYAALIDDFMVPKDLSNDIQGDTVALYIKAINDLKDLKDHNYLLTKKEFKSLSKYIIPKSIYQGLSGDKFAPYFNAATAFRNLQKTRNLTTKVKRYTQYAIGILAALAIVWKINGATHEDEKQREKIIKYTNGSNLKQRVVPAPSSEDGGSKIAHSGNYTPKANKNDIDSAIIKNDDNATNGNTENNIKANESDAINNDINNNIPPKQLKITWAAISDRFGNRSNTIKAGNDMFNYDFGYDDANNNEKIQYQLYCNNNFMNKWDGELRAGSNNVRFTIQGNFAPGNCQVNLLADGRVINQQLIFVSPMPITYLNQNNKTSNQINQIPNSLYFRRK